MGSLLESTILQRMPHRASHVAAQRPAEPLPQMKTSNFSAILENICGAVGLLMRGNEKLGIFGLWWFFSNLTCSLENIINSKSEKAEISEKGTEAVREQ
jgi:hypothetical protein